MSKEKACSAEWIRADGGRMTVKDKSRGEWDNRERLRSCLSTSTDDIASPPPPFATSHNTSQIDQVGAKGLDGPTGMDEWLYEAGPIDASADRRRVTGACILSIATTYIQYCHEVRSISLVVTVAEAVVGEGNLLLRRAQK